MKERDFLDPDVGTGPVAYAHAVAV
jgi:hypothetical protein